MQPIRGVELITLPVHCDARGEVVVCEGAELPFAPARVFLLRTAGAAALRGGHANSCDELIVVVSGSVLAEIDNGQAQASLRLERCSQALLVRAGVVVRLVDFVPGTVLLRCASARYVETRHFAEPRPELLASCPR